jgi:hypothetical protein
LLAIVLGGSDSICYKTPRRLLVQDYSPTTDDEVDAIFVSGNLDVGGEIVVMDAGTTAADAQGLSAGRIFRWQLETERFGFSHWNLLSLRRVVVTDTVFQLSDEIFGMSTPTVGTLMTCFYGNTCHEIDNLLHEFIRD